MKHIIIILMSWLGILGVSFILTIISKEKFEIDVWNELIVLLVVSIIYGISYYVKNKK